MANAVGICDTGVGKNDHFGGCINHGPRLLSRRNNLDTSLEPPSGVSFVSSTFPPLNHSHRRTHTLLRTADVCDGALL